jgi:hypothetical protein
MSIKEMVSGGKRVKFAFYRDGNLWYESENGWQFPVPIEDIGNATFLADDKAILFMRYMRKHSALIETGANEE